MADVSVEFGAKDTGLEATLRSVQSDLETLRSEMENTAMSTDEATSALRRMRQLEGIESQLQTMADATRDVGDASVDSAGMVDDATDSMHNVGDAATDAGERSEMGFGQMAAAVATGQLAVEVAMGAIKAAIEGVSAMFDTFGDAIDLGGKLDILSTRTGVASGELARLGRALQNTGMDADMIGPIFDRFNIAIAEASEGTGEAGAALQKLNIPLERLKGLAPEQQFEVIGKAIQGVSDRSERMNLAIDIFGRGSGTRLLRLFEDYEGTMARVDQQLGIFPQLMNELSSVFEDTGTEIAAVQDKFVEFAAGVFAQFAPAIRAIAKGLASIDAAQLGQDIANALRGGAEAMRGFQTAIDAIQLGELGTAFELIFESIKLQVKQTSNEIYRNLVAAFKTAGDFLGEIFSPSGALLSTILQTMEMFGLRLASSIQRNLASAFAGSWITEGIAEQLNIAANASNTAANVIEDNLVGAGGRIKNQFMDAGRALPDSFRENYQETAPIFDDIAARSEELEQKQRQISEELARQKLMHDQSNQKLTDQVGLYDHSVARSKQLSQELEDIVAELNRTSGPAASTAGSLKSARDHSDALHNNLKGAGESMGTVSGLAESIANSRIDSPAQALNERIDAAQQKYSDFMGALGVPVSPNFTVESMLEQLGIATQGLDDQQIKVEQLERALEALGNAAPSDITPLLDEGSTSTKIRSIGDFLRENFVGLDATPYIDRQRIGEGVEATKNTIESALGEFRSVIRLDPQIQGDIESIKSTLNTEFAEPTPLTLEGDESISQVRDSAESNFAESIPLNLDGDSSVQNIRSALEEPVQVQIDQSAFDAAVASMNAEITNNFRGGDGGEGGDATGGQGGEGGRGGDAIADISQVVNILNPWTQVITAIRDRLPLQALAP